MQFYDLRGLKSEKDQPAQRGRKEELILFKFKFEDKLNKIKNESK